jgi:hypothetical protein
MSGQNAKVQMKVLTPYVLVPSMYSTVLERAFGESVKADMEGRIRDVPLADLNKGTPKNMKG